MAEANINILDISQTIMQKYIFTMVMLVDLSKSTKNIDEITEELNNIGEELGLNTQLQHVDVFNSMHRI